MFLMMDATFSNKQKNENDVSRSNGKMRLRAFGSENLFDV